MTSRLTSWLNPVGSFCQPAPNAILRLWLHTLTSAQGVPKPTQSSGWLRRVQLSPLASPSMMSEQGRNCVGTNQIDFGGFEKRHRVSLFDSLFCETRIQVLRVLRDGEALLHFSRFLTHLHICAHGAATYLKVQRRQGWRRAEAPSPSCCRRTPEHSNRSPVKTENTSVSRLQSSRTASVNCVVGVEPTTPRRLIWRDVNVNTMDGEMTCEECAETPEQIKK